MSRETRYLPSAVSLVVLVLALATGTAAGQSAYKGGERWAPPLTADGRPNLQGDWTNDTYTPLERPADLAGKEFFTREEALAFVKSRTDRLHAQAADDVHYDDAIWQAENYGKVLSLRTSLIVEPRDGKVPPLTAAGKARYPEQLAAQRAERVTNGATSRSLAERCISWGNVGPPMMPPTYSANLEILQTSDAVIIRHELMHDVRIIYLDGRTHPGADVQWLAGHSIGRWDGTTLVVDTTNFTDKTNFRGSPQNTRQDIFATANMHVVERFTPTSADAIRYEFTVDDPSTWTSSWSGEMEMRRTDGPIYEYACHEGNYGLANILRAVLAPPR